MDKYELTPEQLFELKKEIALAFLNNPTYEADYGNLWNDVERTVKYLLSNEIDLKK